MSNENGHRVECVCEACRAIGKRGGILGGGPVNDNDTSDGLECPGSLECPACGGSLHEPSSYRDGVALFKETNAKECECGAWSHVVVNDFEPGNECAEVVWDDHLPEPNAVTDKPKDPLSITFQEFGTLGESILIETTQYGMDCASHGTVTWTGECICAPDKGGCGRVWHLGKDSRQPPESCGSDCTCGKLLHGGDPKSTSMPICPACFVQKWHEQQEKSC